METTKNTREKQVLIIKISKRSIDSALGFIGLGIFNFFNFKNWIIPIFKYHKNKQLDFFSQDFFSFFWASIIAYISISILILLIVNTKKKIKRYKKGNFIFSTLIIPSCGLINTLFDGLKFGLFSGLFFSIILTQNITGLCVGLTLGLYLAIPSGLFGEFSKEKT